MPSNRGGVEYELLGDSREVVNALRKIQEAADRTERKMEELGRKGRQGVDDVGSSAGRMVKSLAAAIGVSGAISSAIGAIRAEFQKTIELAENSRKAQAGFADSARNLLVNFSADKSLDVAGLQERIGEISKNTGTGRNEIAAALSTAFSAKGDLDNRVAANAVEEAFRLLPGDVQAVQQLSGRALDISKASGDTDVKGILGQLVQAQGAARVTNIGQLGSTAIPAALSVIAAGGTSEEGLELFSALSNIAGDERGDQTSTAVIALVEQLKNFTPGKKGKDVTGKAVTIPQDQRDALAAATSTDERIAVLQQSAELREAFLGASSFEKKLQTPITRVLSGDANAALAAARASITGVRGGAAAQAFDQKVGLLDAGPFQRVAGAGRGFAAAEEEFLLGQGQTGAVRDILAKALGKADLAGPDVLAESVALADFDARVKFGGDPTGRAIGTLEGAINDTREFGGAKGQEKLLQAAIDEIKGLRDDLNGGKVKAEPPRGARAVPAAAMGN